MQGSNGSSGIVTIVDAMTRQALAGGADEPTTQDISNLDEFYAYPRGWMKFVSLGNNEGQGKLPNPEIVPGVTIVGSPAISWLSYAGKLDVFALGPYGHLYLRSYNGRAWSGYSDLQHAHGTTVSVARRPPYRSERVT